MLEPSSAPRRSFLDVARKRASRRDLKTQTPFEFSLARTAIFRLSLLGVKGSFASSRFVRLRRR